MGNTAPPRRWPWLVLSLVSLLLSIGFLGLRLFDRPPTAGERAAAPSSSQPASPPAPPLAQAPAAEEAKGPPRTPAVEPQKPVAGHAGRGGEREVGLQGAAQAGQGAAQVKVAEAPHVQPVRHHPVKDKGKLAKLEAPKPMAPMPMAPTRGLTPAVERTGAAPDDSFGGDDQRVAAGPVVREQSERKHHGATKGGKRHPPGRSERNAAPVAEGGEAATAPEPDASETKDDANSPEQVTHLLRGYFAAKIPQRMLLKRPVRVHVAVSDRGSQKQAEATLDAQPTGGIGPALTTGADLLIGRQIQVELRALPSEFEILAITPLKQPIHRGQVAEWSWTVVPLLEGEHELSVVVTNLTDKAGRVYNVKVHEVAVNIEVQTIDKLRAVASAVSSAVSGLASLFGAWMGLLRPLLQRRKEKEEAEAKADDKSGSGGKSSGPDPEKESAAKSPPAAESKSPSDSAEAAASSADKSKELDRSRPPEKDRAS